MDVFATWAYYKTANRLLQNPQKTCLVQRSARQESLSVFVRDCCVHLTYIRNVLVKCDHTHINAFDRHD